MRKRALFVIFVLIMMALVVSCTFSEKEATANTIIPESSRINSENSTPTETTARTEIKTETPSPTQCTAEWLCLSSIYKIHRNENCTLSQKSECKLGCQDGKCRAAETCEPGFKCRNNHTRSYQDLVCAWSNEKECVLGCKDNECVALPKEEASITSESSIENKTSGCTAGWKCADAEYKAYQESDCFIREKIFCAQGCEQGHCKS